MKTAIIILIAILFISCEKEIELNEDYFIGDWECNRRLFFCPETADFASYEEDCQNYERSMYTHEYSFKSNGEVHIYSPKLNTTDTLIWAINGVSETLLISKVGVLGLELPNTLVVTHKMQNEFESITSKFTGVGFAVDEYIFIRI